MFILSAMSYKLSYWFSYMRINKTYGQIKIKKYYINVNIMAIFKLAIYTIYNNYLEMISITDDQKATNKTLSEVK